MNALETIMTRRSVRDYTTEPVAPEQIRAILDAAMHAPSAGDQQPWQFILIDDRAVLDAIPSVHPYCQMARSAAAAIVVCGDLSVVKYAHYWQQDCAAASENLLLAAHALGLGAVWTGLYPAEDRADAVRKLLHLPEHIVPMALIPLGHPAEKPEQANRYREDRVHRNGW